MTPLFPEQASTFAGNVDALYLFLIAITAFFSLLIGTLVVVFAVKYRRKSPDEVALEVEADHACGVLPANHRRASPIGLLGNPSVAIDTRAV